MDTKEIFSPERLKGVSDEFNRSLDTFLSNDYIQGGEENVIHILKLYDTAIHKCIGNETIDRIEKFLLDNERLLFPVLKRRLSGEHFDIELDYAYFLLEKLKSESLHLIKDAWLDMVLKFKLESDYFIDAIKILARNNVISKEEAHSLVKNEMDRIIKDSGAQKLVDVSNFIGYEEYLKQTVKVDKEENIYLYCQLCAKKNGEWQEKYGKQSYSINRIQNNEYYLHELEKLIEMIGTIKK